MTNDWIQKVKWNEDGLVAAVAQDYKTKRVLMLAWINKESLKLSLKEGRAIYWSRSRQKLWRKGEESGNVQLLKGLYLDCDGDALVLEVEQLGGIACHTGRESCFYQKFENDQWSIIDEVITNPEEMYKK
jgi:phosphoribosyl-AMP cyclohydrolase